MKSNDRARHRPLAILFVAVVLLGAAVLGSCRREPPPPDAIALVGDRFISLKSYKRYLARNAGTDLGQLPSEAASALLDQYLEEVLLAEYALISGFNIAAERVAAEVRLNPGSEPIEVRDQLLRDSLLNSVAASIDPPTDEEIERYHAENTDEFKVEDRVHVRQILLKSADEAAKARKRIIDGEDFAKLAMEISVAPTAERGGDIGIVARGDLPRAVERAVFIVEPGQISEVVETAGSFHIFQVIQNLPAGTIALERARPLIESRIRGDRLSERVSELTATAVREIPVSVLLDRVTFSYTGVFSPSRAE